jgi:hypothetical protein
VRTPCIQDFRGALARVKRNAGPARRSGGDTASFHAVGMEFTRDELIECLLDQALEATFPASDPVSISSAVLRETGDPRCEHA